MGNLLCFTKYSGTMKSFLDNKERGRKEGISGMSVRKCFLHSAENFSRETPWWFRKFQIWKAFM